MYIRHFLKIGIFHMQLFKLSLLYFLMPLDIFNGHTLFFLTIHSINIQWAPDVNSRW